MTIHDLICLRFPMQHKPQYSFFRFGLPRLLKKCRAVFTVSETTRQDVAKTYGFPLERIFVVPNGVDASSFAPDASAKPKDPFLLMVGARYSHKNVDEVLDMARLWAKDYRLVVTSCGGEYKAALLKKVAELGLADRVEFKDYLSREALIRLYQGCSGWFIPVFKMGGLRHPPLEALACGGPVIASDIPVHREVLGDAAFFVRLGDAASWATALEGMRKGPSEVRQSWAPPRGCWRNSLGKMQSMRWSAVCWQLSPAWWAFGRQIQRFNPREDTQ